MKSLGASGARRVAVLLLSCVLWGDGSAQEAYWVFFTDKDSAGYDALEYLTPAAVERRVLNGFPVTHPSDYPVREDYVAQVAKGVTEIGYASRWFNALSVRATPAERAWVETLPFVRETRPQVIMSHPAGNEHDDGVLGNDLEDLIYRQINRMQGHDLHDTGWDGSGVRIAVFDAGFPEADIHPVFAHLQQQKSIKATYNFPKKDEYVYKNHWHGTAVLSNICGQWNGRLLGIATDAEFLLARTERSFEPKVEEEYWLAAVEWAERNGAHIINSSLGYTYSRYMQEDMDGKQSLIARAANLAARKGILVVNAAGNDGDSFWKIIGTPADADSVLAVGGIQPYNDKHISFGSFGPTADGRMKPNVSHFGTAVAARPGNNLRVVNGTSFASPLTAGFAACIKEMHPHWSTMQLFREIEKSGHLYPYFDYAHGYGIPQGAYFLENYEQPKPAFDVEFSEEHIRIVPRMRQARGNRPNDFLGDSRLYIHVENSSGVLNKYWVLEAQEGHPIVLSRESLGESPVLLRLHLLGYTQTEELK